MKRVLVCIIVFILIWNVIPANASEDIYQELEAIAEKIYLHNTDNVKEHMTLPTMLDGATIEWITSDSSVITRKGIVTRGDEDVTVTLIAEVTKDYHTVLRYFDVTVKAKAEETEKTGYLYVYFRGGFNGLKEVQQIHMAASRDGLNWIELNGGEPILTSSLGTKGLRDPYIIRSYEGDKFYLMATDLDASSNNWSDFGRKGSKSIMVWESDNLVNWSEQRMVQVSDDNMGCTWAPEAIYDEENKEYKVYWSSADLTNDAKKAVYISSTRDFVTFSQPKIFTQRDDTSVIDTTMIKGNDGRYYRITKREDTTSVYLEAADSIDGEFTKIESNLESFIGFEGPDLFELQDGKYCLMMDGIKGENYGAGFVPFVTDDLSSGQFERLTDGYSLVAGSRHGGVVAVGEAEYNAIMEAWGPEPIYDEYHYLFEEDGSDSKGTLYGNAEINDGVLNLDGTNGTYFALPQGCLDDCDEFTVSMDVKSNMTSGNFFTFTIGNTDQKYVYLRIKGSEVRLVRSTTSWRNEEGFNYVPDVDLTKDFHNYTIVSTADKLSLYIDGELAGEAATTTTNSDIGQNINVMLGKSTYTADLYFSGSYDNVHVYRRALGQKEIGELIGMNLFEKDTEYNYFVNCDEITADLILPEVGAMSGCDITWQTSDESIVGTDGKIVRTDVKQFVTMTAIFESGEEKVSKTYDLTILPLEEDYAYLFAYFTSNSSTGERLYYGVSKDGYNFKALNNGNSVLTNSLGTQCLRDPFIMKGQDGYYYIIATDMKSSLGWSSNYATVVYKTPDLINIVDKEWINYRNFPISSSCTRAWAPQAIWCPEKEAYMVYITMEMPDDDYETVMFRHYATDLCDASTYTDLELMLDHPEGINSAIDGDIIYDKFHDEYIMYFNGKQIAASKTLSGEWSHTGKELPMVTSGGVSMSVEGSNIWKIIGEDKWLIAADGTPFNGGCYALVETTDFETYTQLWSDKGEFSFDFTPRHGYVIPISKRELDNLFEFYGEVPLPTPDRAVFASNSKAVFDSASEAWAVVAAYDEEGTLCDVKTQYFTGEVEIDFTPPEKGKIKLMLWQGDCEPLAKYAEKLY